MLRAYFDESGIHAGSQTTIICGFIGPRNEWRRVARKWQKAMKGKVFHYKEMRNETKLLERLAKILAESRLAGINMGFLGDWDRAIRSVPPHWSTRYPSCYQLVLEIARNTTRARCKARCCASLVVAPRWTFLPRTIRISPHRNCPAGKTNAHAGLMGTLVRKKHLFLNASRSYLMGTLSGKKT